jgi:putative membrane protein insertion efficiency factor
MIRFTLVLIRGYQLLLGPFIGGACRFEPSCSQFAADAITVHGAWRGSWLAAKRLLRCHPFGVFGLDPVPTPSDRSGRPSSVIR